MTALREQIPAAITTALAAALPSATVERLRETPYQEAELPAVNVIDGDHQVEAERREVSSDRAELEVTVTITVAAATLLAAMTALNAIYATAHATLWTNRTLGGLVVHIFDAALELTEPNVDPREQTYIAADMRLRIDYFTDVADVETAG